jgi:hypothetical protein
MSSITKVAGAANRSNQFFLGLLSLTMVGFASDIQAQMFSVTPDRNVISRPGYVLSGGIEPTNVTYTGPATMLPFEDLSFNGNLLKLQAEAGGLVFTMSTGRNLGTTDIRYTTFGAILGSEFVFIRRPKFEIGVPLQITSLYTTMTNTSAQSRSRDFIQNALGFSTGLEAQMRLSSRLRVSLEGTGGYAFSSSAINSNGGGMAQFHASALLYGDALVRSFGLVTGVQAHSRSYRLEESQFNYDMASVSYMLGVTF